MQDTTKDILTEITPLEQPAGVGPQKMREITIQFHPNLLSGILQDKENFRSIRDLIQRSQRGVAFGARATRHVAERLEALAQTPKVSIGIYVCWNCCMSCRKSKIITC